jgi:RimJ/RimL family protein N-acetyltransferase
MIFLRPATMEDSANLLAWRNDPSTYINYRIAKPIAPSHHRMWMEVNVRHGYPTRIVLMADDDKDISVGVVDLQARNPEMSVYEVGITIAPKLRGRGYGREALDLACRRKNIVGRTLTAEIRIENAASKAVFRHCGFKKLHESKGFAFYERAPV